MVLIFTACRKQQANSSLPPPKATCRRLIPSPSLQEDLARGCRAPLTQTVLKNKEGRDLANSLSLSEFCRAAHAGKNSTHLTQLIQKALAASSPVTPWPPLPGHIREGPSGDQSHISAAAEPEMPLKHRPPHTQLCNLSRWLH